MTQDTGKPDQEKTDSKKSEDMHLKLEEQLTRTVKYTGESNKKIMEVLEQQAKNAARSQDLQETFYKNQQDNIQKERKYRRFKMFAMFSPLVLGLAFVIASSYLEYSEYDSPEGYVAQVTITGTIQQGSSTAGADSVINALRKAYADDKAKGVLISISSPGGSPTQSHMIYDELIRLQELHPDKKTKLISTEMVTSGAYWIAAAVDQIAVMETTYVGSVGVISTMFNFSELIDKIGVERLIITAGKSKSILDSFMPAKESDIQKMKDISNEIHKSFIAVMTKSRGDRLTAPPEELFTGDFWMGPEAVELGLVDEVTTPTRLMLREFGTVKFRDYSKRPSFVESMGIAKFSSIMSKLDEVLTMVTSEVPVQAK